MTRGYIIFHRHGHRLPMKSLKGPGILNNDDEMKLWSKYLPNPNRLNKLNEITPILLHPNNGIPKDLGTYPFGCLTDKGMNHLHLKGKLLSLQLKNIKNIDDINKIKVYATNYQRTQVSVQELLHGMFSTMNIKNNNIKIPINVRDISQCSMSFFDGNKTLATNLLTKVQKTEKFKEIENDTNILKTKDILNKLIPLINGPKGFDWMAALDYYACRRAHDINIHNDLIEYENIVKYHMTCRYNVYLTNHEMLGNFASPLIRNINEELNIMYKNDDNNKSPNITIFSGHDVNLLGLLYALKADIIKNNFWPDYGDTITFEYNSNNNINVYYNDKPLDMNMSENIRRNYLTPKELNELEIKLVKNAQLK